MNPEDYQQIEKYHNRELSLSEKEDFERRMLTDPEFADIVHTYGDIDAMLQAKAAGKAREEELKNTLQVVSADFFPEEEKPTRVIPLWNVYWAAAAGLALIALSIVFILNRNSPPTYSEYAQYEQLVLASRSEADQTASQQAAEAFNQARYKEAAEKLEELHEANPENVNIKLYFALSLTETGQYEKADQLLKEIESGPSIYQSTASWHLALSYLKQDKIDASKDQLRKISESSSEYPKARELLEKLEN